MLKSAARDISKGSSQEPFKKKISFSEISSKDYRLNTQKIQKDGPKDNATTSRNATRGTS